jgi:uncharacterized protein (DUF305 family)
MISFIKTTAFAALAYMAASANAADSGAFQWNVPCTPCADDDAAAVGRAAEDCTVKLKVNFFAAETGYFEIEGCTGVNPTLYLSVNRTYLFDQTDDSNWYHLIGFAYEADGAHAAVDELEPGIAPGDSDCAETLSCPAPMYYMNGEYTGVYSNIPDLVPVPEVPSDDFGLDAVEPLFFHPFGDWQGYGAFVTALKFDVNYDQDFFYFCHVHAGMSARIKLLDADGNMLNEENTPALPYEYTKIDPFDFKCGTTNLTDFSDPGSMDTCPDVTVCEGSIAPETDYAECVQAMNCHMMSSMTTNAVGRSGLFCHQMIPHHQNAINMAKSLLNTHDFFCETGGPVEEGATIPWECELLPILYDIINVQASQNIDMRDALSQLGEEEYANCDVDFTMPSGVTPSRKLAEPDFIKEETHRETEECTFTSGIDCKLCEGEEGNCVVKVGVDLLAGELGYYIIEGCEGVNPTLHMEVGRTYLFDQSDISNWYHLIGFSYLPDGAHAGVDELEPGIAPGDSNCAADLSCPAPMYWQADEYVGEYSNTDSLVPLNGSEDFGLDNVEPLFFHPLADWESYGSFVTSLTFDDENFDEDIFYFCHVHSHMTGRIKLIGSDGSKLNEKDTPEIPYQYDCVSEFDRKCGTYGLDSFQPEKNDQCPNFVCYDGAGTIGEMVTCVDAMDCHMLKGMTVEYGDEGKYSKMNDVILFLREMIPHHQNAVNMAKNLLQTGETKCSLEGPVEEGDTVSTACLLDPIVRGIINVQNSQIQAMRGLLEAFGVEEQQQCPMANESHAADSKSVKSLFGGVIALIAGLEFLAL